MVHNPLTLFAVISRDKMLTYVRNDNDPYAHLNNSVYNLLFDTIINKYLIEHCSLRPASAISKDSDSTQSPEDDAIALVVESHAKFMRPLSFPSRLLLGMRVLHIGNSSVQYDVGVFGPLREKSMSGNTGPCKSVGALAADGWKDILADDAPAVVGGFTHVFVDRHARRPIQQMSPGLKSGLRALIGGAKALEKPRL